MAYRKAKPSFMDDLLTQTLNHTTAEGPQDHRLHGLLSPSTSISRSHEDGEEIIAPPENLNIHHLSPQELGQTTPSITHTTTPLLRSHSPSSFIRDVQHIASEASKQQSAEVSHQPPSSPSPVSHTLPKAKGPQIEPNTPRNSSTQFASLPAAKKARKMAPRKVPTPPIHLKVRILALADRHAHPYASVAPKYAFTLKLLPDTLIREVCTHAGIYVSGKLNKYIDSERLEARDGNGHVFEGEEAIEHELGADGEVYLIEEAIDIEEVKRASLRKQDGPKGKVVRTPKPKEKGPRKTPSQRNLEIAEQGGRRARTEPRKTPFQQRSRADTVVRSEPKRRALPMAPLELEDRVSSPGPMAVSPEPQNERRGAESIVESIENSPSSTTLEKRRSSASQVAKDLDVPDHDVKVTRSSLSSAASMGRRNSTTRPTQQDDASVILAKSVGDEPSTTEYTERCNSPSRPAKAEDPDAPIQAVASQPKLPLPTSQAALPSQDDPGIPDSQEPPCKSIEDSSRNDPMATSWKPINAPRPASETEPRSAAHPTSAKAQSLVDAQDVVKQKQPGFLLGKPDPYDISAVLSDDEYYSPRQSESIMSSSIRKLGSAAKRKASASALVPRNSLLITKQPSAAGDSPASPVRSQGAATSQEELAVPDTPLAHAAPKTPAQAGPSSTPGPLLSSPTNHVAAALARGRAKARRQPRPECVVIEDSDVDVYQDVFVDARDQFHTSRRESKSLEASLPWSAPPLRMGGEDPFWTLRTTGRRTSMKDRRGVDVDEEVGTDVKEKKAVEVKQETTIPMLSSDILEAETQALSTRKVSSFNLGPPVKDPKKRVSQESPRKPPAKSPVKLPPPQAPTCKSPLLLVHGSSSSEQGIEEIGYVGNAQTNTEPGSPSNVDGTVTLHDSRSEDVVTDKDRAHDFMAGPLLAEALFADEEPIGPRQIPPEDDELSLPDDNKVCPPAMNTLLDLPPTSLGSPDQSKDEAFQLPLIPGTGPKSEHVTVGTPRSGQRSRRKRKLSDDYDSEEERRVQKKARREARTAKKAEKKRLREEKMAQEEDEERKRQELVQEERKRIALEKAYRRARELEIVVSSPSKAAEMGLDLSDVYDSHQEKSGLGSSPPVLAAVLPVIEESEDSLESRESEDSQSWRRLSKRHISAFSQQEGGITNDPAGLPSPSTMDVPAAEATRAILAGLKAETPQEDGKSAETRRWIQRGYFDDWAFLDTLDTSAYSPLQIHNRIHMQMVQVNLQGQTPRAGQEDEDVVLSERVAADANGEDQVESQPKGIAERQDAVSHGPSTDAQTQKSAEDESDTTRQTIRSPAPSPKDLAPTPVQALEEDSGSRQTKKKQKHKNPRRRRKDNKRKKGWRQKGQPGVRKQFKRKHTVPLGGEGKKI